MLVNIGSFMNRSKAALAGGGTPAWLTNARALKSFLAANASADNPHSRAAMASPPTVTWLVDVGAGFPPSPYDALTTAYRYSDHAGTLNNSARWEGGWRKSIFLDFTSLPSATFGTTGGNTSDGTQAICWRVSISTSASAVAFQVLGYAESTYRFIVDGQYISKTETHDTTGGSNFVVLDFGATASRTITIEAVRGACALAGVFVASGDMISAAPAFAFPGVIFGDSFTEAIGTTFAADGLGQVAADYVGTELWPSGVGGTGYVATQSGSLYNLPQRLETDLAHFADEHGASPKIIVVAMGFNDQGLAGIQAAASSCFDTIRSLCPAAVVFVVGPWDQNAPSAPEVNYASCKSDIQAAMGTRGGFYFLDMQGVAYSQNGSTPPHPNDAGHTTLGLWLNTNIRSAIAAVT